MLCKPGTTADEHTILVLKAEEAAKVRVLAVYWTAKTK